MSKIMILLFSSSLCLLLASTSPLLLCLLVILMAIGASGMLALGVTKWLGLALALIFLGGMMVIFLYATTLAPSQKFHFPPMGPLTFVAASLSGALFLWHFSPAPPTQHSLFTLFLAMPFSQMLFLLVYLLTTLIVVVKFVESFKGAMKPYL